MKRILVAVSLSAALGACATVPPPPPPPVEAAAPAPAFRAADFAWSAARGSGAVAGAIAYAPGGGARYRCSGQPVVLTPDTPYSRWRIAQLYGSSERAAVPVAAVRSRQAARPSDDYSSFVRRASCDETGRFTFTGLPAGGWFIIAVAQPGVPGAEPVALMRHIQTRAGAVRQVVID